MRKNLTKNLAKTKDLRRNNKREGDKMIKKLLILSK